MFPRVKRWVFNIFVFVDFSRRLTLESAHRNRYAVRESAPPIGRMGFAIYLFFSSKRKRVRNPLNYICISTETLSCVAVSERTYKYWGKKRVAPILALVKVMPDARLPGANFSVGCVVEFFLGSHHRTLLIGSEVGYTSGCDRWTESAARPVFG